MATANTVLFSWSDVEKLPELRRLEMVLDALPDEELVAALESVRVDHANAFIALQLAVEILHEARLEWCDGSIHVLENRIEFSRHSLIDIVDALSTATPSTSFKLVSVLLEQMAYKTNPHCQYPTS